MTELCEVRLKIGVCVRVAVCKIDRVVLLLAVEPPRQRIVVPLPLPKRNASVVFIIPGAQSRANDMNA